MIRDRNNLHIKKEAKDYERDLGRLVLEKLAKQELGEVINKITTQISKLKTKIVQLKAKP